MSYINSDGVCVYPNTPLTGWVFGPWKKYKPTLDSCITLCKNTNGCVAGEFNDDGVCYGYTSPVASVLDPNPSEASNQSSTSFDLTQAWTHVHQCGPKFNKDPRNGCDNTITTSRVGKYDIDENMSINMAMAACETLEQCTSVACDGTPSTMDEKGWCYPLSTTDFIPKTVVAPDSGSQTIMGNVYKKKIGHAACSIPIRGFIEWNVVEDSVLKSLRQNQECTGKYEGCITQVRKLQAEVAKLRKQMPRNSWMSEMDRKCNVDAWRIDSIMGFNKHDVTTVEACKLLCESEDRCIGFNFSETVDPNGKFCDWRTGPDVKCDRHETYGYRFYERG